MFGVFSCFGLVFIYFYVPETSGLSEQEKKEIFMPGGKYGRKLKAGEECEVGYEHRSDITIQEEVFQSAVALFGGERHGSDGDISAMLSGNNQARKLSSLYGKNSRVNQSKKLGKMNTVYEDMKISKITEQNNEDKSSASSHSTFSDKTDELDEDLEKAKYADKMRRNTK